MKGKHARAGVLAILLVFISGALSMAAPVSDGGAVNISCFVYHRFGDARYPSTNISLNDFKSHLDYLQRNDIDVITLGEAVEVLRQGRPPSRRTVVITVDDGYTSFYENAMPLLRRYGYPVTLFVNTAAVGGKSYMNWEELRQIQKEGIEIGNHSHGHDYFVNSAAAELREIFKEDLQRSRGAFRDRLGVDPALYSYPYGEYTSVMAEVLQSEGFEAAVAQNSGVMSASSKLFALPRFPMGGIYADLKRFTSRADMKALAASVVNQPNHLLQEENPPLLQLRLGTPEQIVARNLQCFVAGSKDCRLDYDGTTNILTMQADKPLRARRTLYTVTAPSASHSGVFHWYSYLWIDAGMKE